MECLHKNAVSARGGILRPGERLYNYESAWCPDCGAFRDAAAFTTAEPWREIGFDVSSIPDRIITTNPKPKKKAKKKTRK